MKHKIQMSKREWTSLGLKTGWISKEAYQHRDSPRNGSGVKSIVLYRGQTGEVSANEDLGVPFEADIYYNYIPAEDPMYSDGQMTYPGAPKTVDILEVKDATNGESIDIDTEDLKLKFRNELIDDYESEFQARLEDSLI